jgi:FeoB-associated Cys-rich membrane protein
MVQDLIVAAFILFAVSYLGLRAWRSLRGKKTGCGCDTCPAVKKQK